MIIRDFLEMALDGTEAQIRIWSLDAGNTVYCGSVEDALEDDDMSEMLSQELTSWDVANGELCLNY